MVPQEPTSAVLQSALCNLGAVRFCVPHLALRALPRKKAHGYGGHAIPMLMPSGRPNRKKSGSFFDFHDIVVGAAAMKEHQE
jgi:hypothetical protein